MTNADNRVEQAWARLKARPLRALLVAVLLFAAADSLLAWSYLAKRAAADQPYPDLLERYYALRPFRSLFLSQYGLPEGWWDDRFLGDTGSPATVRAFWVADPLLGHRLRPNAIVTENGWTWRATKPQGFIVTEPDNPVYAPQKPPGVFRIIMLGGSTVEGDGASGSLTALPAVLLQTLRAQYAPAVPAASRFDVINAGVGGYDSAQELLYCLSELSRYEADLVLLYDGWNDQQIRVMRFNRQAGRLATQQAGAQAAALQGLYDWDTLAVTFLQRSAAAAIEILRGFAMFDMPFRLFAQKLSWGGIGAAPPAVDDLTPEAGRRYLANVELMAYAAARQGSSVAWFLQPVLGVGNKPMGSRELAWRAEPFADAMVRERNRFYGLAREGQRALAQAAAGICARDLTDIFDGVAEVVYEDGGHLFDNGNTVVAQRIAAELAACGLVRPRGAGGR